MDAKVYHMGTKRDGDRLLTAGGRVMMVVAEGSDIRDAYRKVYAEVGKIRCEALFHRRDIAHWALDGRLLDGKALSDRIKEELRDRVGKLEVKYGRKPSLAVIIVGNNPASQVYVRNKVKTAIYVGMNSRLITMAEDVTEEALLQMIDNLNRDPEVDGILVQLPLPKQIDEARVIDAIAKEKDVDGFHVLNVGDLWLGRSCSVPCTPEGHPAADRRERHRPVRQDRRGRGPQQHRRQAGGQAPAGPQRHRDHRAFAHEGPQGP